MRIVFTSDTHSYHRRVVVPDGDMFVHCGDITHRGEFSILRDFNSWLETLPHRHKAVIAGNHDFNFADAPMVRSLLPNATYLLDNSVIIEGVKFFGSPFTPWFYDWAFNFSKGDKGREEARRKWAQIPEDTDVLLTHGPVYQVLDRCEDGSEVGCKDLLGRVKQVKPSIHAFGHIHEGYGARYLNEELKTVFVNASFCDARYNPIQSPIVVDIDPLTKEVTFP